MSGPWGALWDVRAKWARATTVWWFRALGVTAALLVAGWWMAAPSLNDEAPIRAGEPSPRTVIAPDLITVDDEEATERARRRAAESVDEVVVFDREAQARIAQRVRDVFAAVRDVREPELVIVDEGDEGSDEDDGEPVREEVVPPEEEQAAALRDRFAFLGRGSAEAAVALSDARVDELEQEVVDLTQELARQRIREEELEQAVDAHLEGEFAVRGIDVELAETVVAPVVRNAMEPTAVVDEEETQRRRDEAADGVDTVRRSFPGGTPVVTAGEVPDGLQVAALEDRGLAGSDPQQQVVAAAALTVVMATVGAGTLWGTSWGRRVLRRHVGLLAAMAALHTVAVGSLALLDIPANWAMVTPAATLPMLGAAVISTRVGFALLVPALIPLLFVTSAEPVAVVAYVTSATLAVPAGAAARSRRELLRTGVLLAAATAAAVAAASTAFAGGVAPSHAAAAAVGALGSVALVHTTMPLWESMFGVATVSGLLDLADRNHPLLRELERHAPGSYNHSVQVATMVERACREIGADALLGSVQALYHDIGKVANPSAFIENQMGVPNPHDQWDPRTSAEVIIRHVADGVERAHRYRFPPEVVEGIATHHGTTSVAFFLHRARQEADAEETVDEREFRYSGPKPRSKEAAVLMLADGCESATRARALSGEVVDRETIAELVHKLTSDRVNDGQLDESELTFADLDRVRTAFVDSLLGAHHHRVPYPQDKS